MALIPLNTFKTKTAVLTTLNYNQAKCSRDTGLIIDSIAYDMLFGGDTQTAFAATQYWAQSATNIPGEVFETLSALEHAKNVTKQLVMNTTVIKSVGNTIAQNKSNTTTTDVVVAIIDAEFELIMDIIQNGTAGTSDNIISNNVTITGGESTPAVKIVQQEYPADPTNPQIFSTPVDYEMNKNQVSIYVDGVRQYNISERSNSQVALEPAGTTHGVFIEVIQAEIGVGSSVTIRNTTYTPTQSDVDSTDRYLYITTPVYSLGKNQLRVYITGIRQYYTEYTEINTTSIRLNLHQSLRINDIIFVEVLDIQIVDPGGYASIVDKVYTISDTSQTAFTTPPYVPGQNLLSVYVTGQRKYIDVDYTETDGTQITFSPGNIFNISDVILIEIISAASAVGQFNINYTLNDDIKNAAATMAANKTFLQHEIVAFVNNRFGGGYVYDPIKCARDTGLIVDSLAFDLLFSGNSQSTYSGLQYWTQATTTHDTIPGELSQTIAALRLAQSVIESIVLNKSYIGSNGNTVKQIINQSLVSNQESAITLATLMDDIINIINNGMTGVPDKIIPNGTLTVAEPLLNAYSLLQVNKPFIQAEVIAWINDQIVNDISPFTAPVWPTVLTNVIRDSATTIGFDVTTNLLPGTSVTITGVGTSTLTIGGSPLVNGQTYYFGDPITTSTATLYATLAEAIAGDTGKLPIVDGTTTGFTFTVNPNNSDKCYRDVSYIIDSISFDLIYGGNRQSTQAGAYYFGFSSTSSISADGLIITDGDFTIGEAYTIVSTAAVGGIETDFTSLGAKNNAPGTLFVATMPGTGTGTGTATRADEVAEALSAYNYMKLLIYGIVEAQPITEIYQSIVPQVISTNYGTIKETNEVVANIDLITNIIKQGKSVAPAPHIISLVQSSDRNTQNAANLLLANKEFIKAEVIAYINNKTQNAIVDAGYFVVGKVYTIKEIGSTTQEQWNKIAGTFINQASTVTYAPGMTFKAVTIGTASGTGTAVIGYTYYSPYTIINAGSFIIGETYSIVSIKINEQSPATLFTAIGAT